jgi:Bacteriocin-protection, YdeI or OmpD-Associated/Domain of unknown function (DUF1905)
VSSTAPVRFDAVIEPMAWGRSTYTVIRLPADAVAAWRSDGVKRVAGTIDGVEVDLAITTAPVIDDAFVWAGAALLRRIEAEAGEVVTVELQAADPDAVRVPTDLAAAIEAAGGVGRWEALTPAQRRRHVYGIESARTDATRSRRITALVAELC